MQDGVTLQASARETYIEELDDDESVSESHLTTEAPTILQPQTPKDKKETTKTKDEFREIKIKVERSVNDILILLYSIIRLLLIFTKTISKNAFGDQYFFYCHKNGRNLS